jgi:hypothetical protein
LFSDIRWLAPPDFDPNEFGERVSSSVVVEASNVMTYWESQKDRPSVWTEMPSCRLPFPSMFVEAHAWRPHFVGTKLSVLLVDHDVASALDAIGTVLSEGQASRSRTTIQSDLPGLRDAAKYSIAFGLIMLSKGKVVGPLTQGKILLGAHGEPLRAPFGQIPNELVEMLGGIEEAKQFSKLSLFPIMLAVAFMNCKNVVVAPNEPDRHLNRERRKHGLKPFLRYHTINIEPMKKVLKTEGKIESLGLKRALHIVRGHFSTYTEEKPLFGKVAGTFWIPSHVRGSTEEGVVVSDYQISAPRQENTQ